MNTPNDPSIDLPPTVTLARLYEKQGLLEQAADMYRRLIVQEPDNASLKAALEAVERRLGGSEEKGGQSGGLDLLPVLEKWHQTVRWRKQRLTNGRDAIRLLFIHVPDPSTGEAESGVVGPRDDKDPGSAEKTAVGGNVTVASLFSSDLEVITETIRDASQGYDALIIQCENDAIGEEVGGVLSSLVIPVIEIVQENIYAKNPSVKPTLASAVTAQLVGLGEDSFAMAVRAAADMVKPVNTADVEAADQ